MTITCHACKGLGLIRSATEYRENYNVICDVCRGIGILYVEEIQNASN